MPRLELVQLDPTDFDDVHALLTVMHAESRLSAWPMRAREETRRIYDSLIALPLGYVKGLMDESGLHGVLIAEVTSHPFVDVLGAVDHFWYVHPDRRGSVGAVRRLLDDFEAWAKSVGADVIAISADAGICDDKTARLLEHWGYRGQARTLYKG